MSSQSRKVFYNSNSAEKEPYSWKEIDVIIGGYNDRFGSNVAIDNNTVLIGSPNFNNNRGIAYIYDFNELSIPIATLVSDNSNTNESLFGNSVAIFDTHVVISAPYESYDDLQKAGSIYIFEKNNSGNWIHTKRITNPSQKEYDYFGHSIAIHKNNIVVSAINNDGNDRSGFVYVYNIDDYNNVNLESTLISNYSDDSFGSCITIYDDLIVVGAPRSNNSKGTVYIYRYNDTLSWILEYTLGSLFSKENSFFGFSLSLYETNLIVGSYGQDRIEIF